VILQFSVSVDGYVEGPNCEIDWRRVDDEFNAFAVETIKATQVMILGRKTYEFLAVHWPTATDADPAVTEVMDSTPNV
jgi:dihydrofolate reductase